VDANSSSLEDWQREARKLELQGKQEQVDAIRRDILRQSPVPWPVFDQTKTTELLIKVFRDRAPGGKPRQQLFDIACCHDEPMLAVWLARNAGLDAARQFDRQRSPQGRKSYAAYFSKNFKEILYQCASYGMEHRLPMNQTPLMAAAAAGNVALVEALLERGADRQNIDHFGCNALHWAMREAFRDQDFAKGPFGALYELLAPESIDVNRALGLYQFNSALSVRQRRNGEDVWTPIFEALNLPFIAEFTPSDFGWNGARLSLQSYLEEAGMPEASLPIAEERMQGEN
jgi:hypothetical protein